VYFEFPVILAFLWFGFFLLPTSNSLPIMNHR
jgi:hypothetical protein